MVVPLYLEEHVRETLPRFAGHEYGEWFEAAPGMRFRFRDAGHILGSAWIEAEIGTGPDKKTLVFTGDYGRDHQPILRDPEPLSEADVYISESTYGIASTRRTRSSTASSRRRCNASPNAGAGGS